MSNYRQPFGVSYLDNGRNGYNSGYSKNYNHGYSNKSINFLIWDSPTLSIDEGHNLGEL